MGGGERVVERDIWNWRVFGSSVKTKFSGKFQKSVRVTLVRTSSNGRYRV